MNSVHADRSPERNGKVTNGNQSHLSIDSDPIEDSLHRIAEVRERQGVSLRTAARHWNLDVAKVREQEDPNADLTLSQLYAWQQLLNVPVSELLNDADQPLSTPVMKRAQLVRLMKTAVTLQDAAQALSVQRLSTMLIEQLVEIMPELSEIGPWRGSEGNNGPRPRELHVFRLPDDRAFGN